MLEDKNNPGKPSAAYKAMQAHWELPDALMGGTPAMRAKGKEFLPREPAESEAAYINRLERSFLFNAFARTIKSAKGRVFAKPMQLSEDVPELIGQWSEDIDLTGQHIDVFARDVFEDGMVHGISHVLVDMPQSRPGATVAEERAQGIRPYWVHVKAKNLVGWRSEMRGGREVLTQIRMLESSREDDGEFGEVSVERIRVIEPFRYRLFRKDAKGEWVIESEGATSFPYVPLATFYANRTGYMMAKPPLEDMAQLNLCHWQSSSDQRHILHVARVPILFGSGLSQDEKGDKIEIGPNRLVMGPEGSRLEYVEHAGASIQAGRTDLQDLEDQMRLMGYELTLPRQSGDVTATAKAIDTADANSALEEIAGRFKDCLELALRHTANMYGISGDSGGSVVLNSDFNLTPAEDADLQALQAARNFGDLSRETLWSEWKRRGLLSDDFNAVEEAERLEQEGPGLGMIGREDGDGE